jgi:threonyl-tRNA synthetase
VQKSSPTESNITPERLRFDFNFDRKLTEKELEDVEKLVNDQIKKSLPVKREEMTVEEAKEIVRGAQSLIERAVKEIRESSAEKSIVQEARQSVQEMRKKIEEQTVDESPKTPQDFQASLIQTSISPGWRLAHMK